MGSPRLKQRLIRQADPIFRCFKGDGLRFYLIVESFCLLVSRFSLLDIAFPKHQYLNKLLISNCLMLKGQQPFLRSHLMRKQTEAVGVNKKCKRTPHPTLFLQEQCIVMHIGRFISYLIFLMQDNPGRESVLNQQQLSSALFDHYLRIRNEQLPALHQHIPAEFESIQRQIIAIVELRKNMEKVLEVEAMQAQHFKTVSNLVQHNLKLNDDINQVVHHAKSANQTAMGRFIDGLREQQKGEADKESQIIAKSQRLLLQLADFRRSFNAETAYSQPHTQSDDDEAEGTANYFQQSFSQLLESQQRRWDLVRFIYSVKLKELSLRDELLEERERGQQDFQRGNSELIETLLREKERDKNLRKKDNEKFGQLIKQRDQIDMECEHLSHSEKSLLPHLQNQLVRLKTKTKENESRHEIEMQKVQKKNEQLVKDMQRVNSENKRLEMLLGEKQAKYNEISAQLKFSLQQTESLKKNAETTLKIVQGETERELEKARLKCKKLQQENAQLQAKNQQLQSQYNQLILKSSQLNHIKADLAQKFDKTAKKAQQLQSKLQQFKASLSIKNQELLILQSSINTLKCQKDSFQELINNLHIDFAQSKENVRQCQQKIAGLEKELTDNFILHNQEIKNLQQQIQQKQHILQRTNISLQHFKHQQQPHLPQADLPTDLYSTLREQITAELERSQRIKSSLIDQFVDKIGHLLP